MDAQGQIIGDSDFDELLSSELPNKIKYPHHTHPLNLMLSRNRRAYVDYCLICENCVPHDHYSCELCRFHLCRYCLRKPLVIDRKRSHEHPLSVVPSSSLIFTCLACGVNDSSSFLCICIPCGFIIHLKCVSLPRVICINRHDHRISYVSSLDHQEDQNCKVCRKTVDWRYGSYSCSTCINYVVHSLCATSRGVWDGIELEGVPEEDPETILPFKVVGEGVIKYFSHDHNLRLINIDKEKDDHANQTYIQCNACVGHIYSDSYYICTHDECSFVLHEACANLLQKKRHPSNPHRLTLLTKIEEFSRQIFFQCNCCGQNNSGFTYMANPFYIDVRCASILDGCVHGSHPHPLYFNYMSNKYCSGCNSWNRNMMNCEECEGCTLCFRCATLPYEVKHKYDRRVLSLCYGEENPDGVYWCEICEKRLDPSKWFYTCGECCSTLHIHCILGENPYIKLGAYSDKSVGSFEVVHNNYISFQPKCHMVRRHGGIDVCHGINVFKSKKLFFCSYICLEINSG